VGPERLVDLSNQKLPARKLEKARKKSSPPTQGAFVGFPWEKPCFRSENLSAKSILGHQGIREAHIAETLTLLTGVQEHQGI